MKRKLVILMLAGGLVFSVSIAAAQEPEESGKVFYLGEIEVVDSAKKNKNISSDAVYDEEFRLFRRDDVAEAANLLSGVHLTEVGGRNEQTIYIRGFDIKHAPLFMDGIPVYVPYDGYPDLGRFSTLGISKIVVSKGFTSVLYGPNTMGGAINLISRRPDKKFEGEVGGEYASWDTYRLFTNLGSNMDSWYVQGGANYFDRDHYEVSDDFDSKESEDGGSRENSYYEAIDYNLKLGLTPGDGDDEYTISYYYLDTEKGVPPYAGCDPSQKARFWQWPKWKKQSIYFSSKTSLGENAYVKTRIYYDDFENKLKSYDDDSYSSMTQRYAFTSVYDDYTYGGLLETGVKVMKHHQLKLALHYKRDVHRSRNNDEPELEYQAETYSGGLEDTIDITDNFYSIIGVGYDFMKMLDAEELNSEGAVLSMPVENVSAFSPQLGLFYSFTEFETVYAAAAYKTRFPTMKDMYPYKMGRALPNPDLEEERAINYECGLESSRSNGLSFKTAGFYSTIRDFIQLVPAPDPQDTTATLDQNKNIGEVDQYGWEVSLSGKPIPALDLGGNYTFLERHNESGDEQLIDTPKHKAFSYAKFTFADVVSILIDMEYQSKHFSSSDGVRVADSFTLFNSKLIYAGKNGIEAELGVDNIFDKDYEIDEGYPQPGRRYFGNLSYRF